MKQIEVLLQFGLRGNRRSAQSLSISENEIFVVQEFQGILGTMVASS